MIRPSAPLVFMVWTLLIQLVGAAAALVLSGSGLPPVMPLGVAALSTFILARQVKLPLSWQFLNLLLPPAAALTFWFDFPPALWLGGTILLLLVFAPTFFTRVPYYPTTADLYHTVAEQLPREGAFTFIDLGCGFGGLLFYLAKNRPQGRYVGIELGLLPWFTAALRAALFGRRRVSIQLGDLWKSDLSRFDYIYAFLAPPPMPRLHEKIRAEAHGAAVVLINSLRFPL